jgi:hypothetical protein
VSEFNRSAKMPLITKSGMKLIAVIAVVACAGLFVAYKFSPGGLQRRNLRRAEDHIARFAGALTSQPRFQKVSFVAGFMDDGCITVSGEVRSSQDLTVLRQLWEETSPPVITRYFVVPTGAEKESPNRVAGGS